MGCGSSSDTTSTVQNKPPAQVLAAYTALLGRGNTVANLPLTQYGGAMVNGFTPDQQQAFGNIRNSQGIQAPYLNAASQYAGIGAAPVWPGVPQYGQDQIDKYSSPYTNDVVNSTLANINEQNSQQQSGLAGNAIQAGNAFGGDRAGIAAAQLARSQDLSRDQTIAQLRNQGFSNAQQEFNQQQGTQISAQQGDAARAANAAYQFGGLGTQAQQGALTGASAQLQAGALQQQLGQEQLNVPYEQFLQRQAYPFQTTNFLGGLTEGLAPGMGGTTTTSQPGPSTASQIAGLGMAGLGLAGSFFGMDRGGRVPHMAAGGDVPGGVRGNMGEGYSQAYDAMPLDDLQRLASTAPPGSLQAHLAQMALMNKFMPQAQAPAGNQPPMGGQPPAIQPQGFGSGGGVSLPSSWPTNLPLPGGDDHHWTKALQGFIANNDIAGYENYLTGKGKLPAGWQPQGGTGSTGGTGGSGTGTGSGLPGAAPPPAVGLPAFGGYVGSTPNVTHPAQPPAPNGVPGLSYQPAPGYPGVGIPQINPAAFQQLGPPTDYYNPLPQLGANGLPLLSNAGTTSGTGTPAAAGTPGIPAPTPMPSPAPAPGGSPQPSPAPGGTPGPGTPSGSPGGFNGGGEGQHSGNDRSGFGGVDHGFAASAGNGGFGNAGSTNSPSGGSSAGFFNFGPNQGIDLGPWGAGALQAATFAPYGIGSAASLAQLAMRGYNTANADAVRTSLGAPSLDFGQILGSLAGLNNYGALSGNQKFIDSSQNANPFSGAPVGVSQGGYNDPNFLQRLFGDKEGTYYTPQEDRMHKLMKAAGMNAGNSGFGGGNPNTAQAYGMKPGAPGLFGPAIVSGNDNPLSPKEQALYNEKNGYGGNSGLSGSNAGSHDNQGNAGRASGANASNSANMGAGYHDTGTDSAGFGSGGDVHDQWMRHGHAGEATATHDGAPIWERHGNYAGGGLVDEEAEIDAGDDPLVSPDPVLESIATGPGDHPLSYFGQGIRAAGRAPSKMGPAASPAAAASAGFGNPGAGAGSMGAPEMGMATAPLHRPQPTPGHFGATSGPPSPAPAGPGFGGNTNPGAGAGGMGTGETPPADTPAADPAAADPAAPGHGIGGNFFTSPWAALMAAGLGTMAGRSPHAAQNIGAGGLEGLRFAQQGQQIRNQERRYDAELAWRKAQQEHYDRRDDLYEKRLNQPHVDNSGDTVTLVHPDGTIIDTGIPTSAGKRAATYEQHVGVQEDLDRQRIKLEGARIGLEGQRIGQDRSGTWSPFIYKDADGKDQTGFMNSRSRAVTDMNGNPITPGGAISRPGHGGAAGLNVDQRLYDQAAKTVDFNQPGLPNDKRDAAIARELQIRQGLGTSHQPNAPAEAPAVGAIVPGNGGVNYRFKGGDPSDKANWEAVQ